MSQETFSSFTQLPFYRSILAEAATVKLSTSSNTSQAYKNKLLLFLDKLGWDCTKTSPLVFLNSNASWSKLFENPNSSGFWLTYFQFYKNLYLANSSHFYKMTKSESILKSALNCQFLDWRYGIQKPSNKINLSLTPSPCLGGYLNQFSQNYTLNSNSVNFLGNLPLSSYVFQIFNQHQDNLNNIIKYDRWLYKYSLTHRKTLNYVNKLSSTKKLLANGFFDKSFTSRNLWLSNVLSTKGSKATTYRYTFNELYKTPLFDSRLLHFSLLEESFIWNLKRFSLLNSSDVNTLANSSILKPSPVFKENNLIHTPYSLNLTNLIISANNYHIKPLLVPYNTPQRGVNLAENGSNLLDLMTPQTFYSFSNLVNHTSTPFLTTDSLNIIPKLTNLRLYDANTRLVFINTYNVNTIPTTSLRFRRFKKN